jgi:hypothetical protein
MVFVYWTLEKDLQEQSINGLLFLKINKAALLLTAIMNKIYFYYSYRA